MQTSTKCSFQDAGCAIPSARPFSLRNVAVAVVATWALATAALAGRYARVQSPARPFGLDVVDGVQIRNSDSRGRTFSGDHYDWVQDVAGNGMTQPAAGVGRDNVDTILLDPGRLSILNDYAFRAYFVQGATTNRNSLGINPNGGGVGPGAQLIFPDMTESGRRTPASPMRSRDFVDLGLIPGGSLLDFFLIADGANGGTDVFTTDPAMNPDGLQHVAIHARTDTDTPFLLLGFEDVFGGGDGDFNDALIAMDIGVDNVRHLISTVGAPEPGTMTTIGVFLAAALGVGRRRRGSKS